MYSCQLGYVTDLRVSSPCQRLGIVGIFRPGGWMCGGLNVLRRDLWCQYQVDVINFGRWQDGKELTAHSRSPLGLSLFCYSGL